MNLIAIPEERITQFESSLDQLNSKIESIIQANSQGNPQSLDSAKWISKQEAAKRLNVCSKTIDSYMKKGILPYSQFKSKLYIKPSDIDKILERHYVNNSK